MVAKFFSLWMQLIEDKRQKLRKNDNIEYWRDRNYEWFDCRNRTEANSIECFLLFLFNYCFLDSASSRIISYSISWIVDFWSGRSDNMGETWSELGIVIQSHVSTYISLLSSVARKTFIWVYEYMSVPALQLYKKLSRILENIMEYFHEISQARGL